MSLLDGEFSAGPLAKALEENPGRLFRDEEIAPGSQYEDFDKIRSMCDEFVADS